MKEINSLYKLFRFFCVALGLSLSLACKFSIDDCTYRRPHCWRHHFHAAAIYPADDARLADAAVLQYRRYSDCGTLHRTGCIGCGRVGLQSDDLSDIGAAGSGHGQRDGILHAVRGGKHAGAAAQYLRIAGADRLCDGGTHHSVVCIHRPDTEAASGTGGDI